MADQDKTYDGDTGLRHTFRADYWMTISFILDDSGQVDGDYPIYLLESADGSYSQKLSAGSDLVAEGDYMQLQFKKLAIGKQYKLTRYLDEDWSEIIFDGVAFDTIVDQDRDIHGILPNHKYGELEVDLGSQTDAITWQPPAPAETPAGAETDLSEVVL